MLTTFILGLLVAVWRDHVYICIPYVWVMVSCFQGVAEVLSETATKEDDYL